MSPEWDETRCHRCGEAFTETSERAEVIQPPRALTSVTAEDYVMTDPVRLLVHVVHGAWR